MTKKSVYFGVFILFIIGMISCEKDFNDIASNVVKNTKFETKDTIIEVVVTNKAITSVRADGLTVGGTLGQYLLGVYNNPNYEKIEASVVSQLALDNTARVADKTYGADTTVVTTIDTVFLKIPYQGTLKTDSRSEYVLDSIIGDKTKAFSLNLYRTETYMNRLNPADPSKLNNYSSDATYQVLPGELNAQVDYQFIPNALDTMMIYKRRLSNGTVYKTDTLKLSNNNPFARIPLDEAKIKEIFVDEYETSSHFETQEAINDYFKGLYIEAKGNEGSLMAFNIATTNFDLKPSIEIRYTKTVLKGGSTVVDTIVKTNSFLLSNFSTSLYKMNEKVYPNDKNIIIQGTAGNMAQIEMLDNSQLNVLKSKNWLINEASLTFYVNQDIVGQDTIQTPYKLFLYKDGINKAQIKDHVSEGPAIYDGKLVITDKKPDYYRFRITDYVSDLLNGTITDNPILGLKVFNNPTDGFLNPIDTLITDHNWNPKAVTLLNHDKVLNGERRARLKISYSIKK
mgnify:FL=1